jgi:acetolactate synthase-1/2/3 large subunit
VDIDKAELDKPTLSTDLKICASSAGFFPRLARALDYIATCQAIDLDRVLSHWYAWRHWLKVQDKIHSPVTNALKAKPNCVNPYRLINRLTHHLPENTIIVCADGTACVVGFQSAYFKQGQRMFHNSGCASMGYELPAAIGAYHASNDVVTCLAGDGSIMMNLQELAFISGERLPIKIVLLNNQGYHSIRQVQNNYFAGNLVGCGEDSGLPFPSFASLCRGFGIEYVLLDDENDIESSILSLYSSEGPGMLEVILDLHQEFAPKLASKKLADGSMVTAELEDMSPLLGDEIMADIKSQAYAIC